MSGRSKLAINRLRERRPDQDAADRFLERHTFPIVEEDTCTFAVRVDDVDAVYLRHRVVGLPGDLPMRRLHGTWLWFLVLELPPNSRVEYQFESRRGDDWHRFNDPGNPRLARSPVGDSSVCLGPGYQVPPWTVPDPEARPGDLIQLDVPSTAQRRTNPVQVYLPARLRSSSRYPLLVVHDGPDYLDYAGMRTVLDNLIHSLDVAEVVVAFLRPGERLIEYADNAAHARYLVHELLPFLEQRLPLSTEPQDRCLMGSSFGAVASFSVAYRNPGAFGSLLLQSGSFVFTDIGAEHGEDPAFDPVVKFVNRYRARPVRMTERMFVSCGVYEPLITANRSMVPVFSEAGIEVDYVESRDGHSWESWRDRLRDGLSWVFPGPSAFVYE